MALSYERFVKDSKTEAWTKHSQPVKQVFFYDIK